MIYLVSWSVSFVDLLGLLLVYFFLEFCGGVVGRFVCWFVCWLIRWLVV